MIFLSIARCSSVATPKRRAASSNSRRTACSCSLSGAGGPAVGIDVGCAAAGGVVAAAGAVWAIAAVADVAHDSNTAPTTYRLRRRIVPSLLLLAGLVALASALELIRPAAD